MNLVSQETFQDCYRGRQSFLHHLAYMRSAKVALIWQILREQSIDLNQKRILDYGFGAGSFLRSCPKNSILFGVEIDPHTVAEVSDYLKGRGFSNVQLTALQPELWHDHEVFKEKYDVIICSHVLEHVDKPDLLISKLAGSLNSQGHLIVLLPINERKLDPHHQQAISWVDVERWSSQAGLSIQSYIATDYACYWVQPIFAGETIIHRTCARVLSLTMGLAAAILGVNRWMRCWDFLGPKVAARPTQRAFCLSFKPSNNLSKPSEPHDASSKKSPSIDL
jgi:2-polyprenyl-3-methyl-5-hydroxy-6-metoxy-1,4-benzoquinol methylase